MTAPRYWHIYCDESRHFSCKFMVLGGVMLDREYEGCFDEAFAAYREEQRMFAELKWTKLSAGKLAEYKQLVDLVHSHRQHIQFKALVVPLRGSDWRRYNKNYDQAFARMQYQLLVNMFGRFLRQGDRCNLIVDQRQSSEKLSKLAAIANNGLKKNHNLVDKPIREIKAANSKECIYIQVADVLMGAVGFEANGDDRKQGACGAKIELMRHIKMRYGIWSLAWNTERGKQDFSIWSFRFEGK